MDRKLSLGRQRERGERCTERLLGSTSLPPAALPAIRYLTELLAAQARGDLAPLLA
jgi:hypothetical protein